MRAVHSRKLLIAFAAMTTTALVAMPIAAAAQPKKAAPTMRARLDRALDMIAKQQQQIDAQATDLRLLRERLDSRERLAEAQPTIPPARLAQGSASAGTPGDPAGIQTAVLERVGQAPTDSDRPLELAVLDQQGSVVTRKGQLTAELGFEYARADRNRAIFRGIELVESVLVGVFDINESRQDVLTAAASLRYGLTDRLELGVRLPYVYRSDASVIAPISGSTQNDSSATIDNSVKGNGIGDLELSARYQLVDAHQGWPYLIGNFQAVLPTGDNPFTLPRDDMGRALRASTGAGFYGFSPSVTAILPSDPVVLFGTVGYTFNLGRSVNTRIPPVIIDFVNPGDAISASAGIGISFNQRTSINLGYAHSWAFGTLTRTRLVMPTPEWPDLRETTTRDLQIGRFLFGVTYRVNDQASLNWSVEVGATDDATDLRTVLRIPITLITGG
jgi:hypothetical protein